MREGNSYPLHDLVIATFVIIGAIAVPPQLLTANCAMDMNSVDMVAGPRAVDFIWSPSQPEIGEMVLFEIHGADVLDSAIWDFGGQGCSDFQQHTTCTAGPWVDCLQMAYQYASSGTKIVRLTVVVDGSPILVQPKLQTVQNSGSCPLSCVYNLSPTSESFPAAGGAGSVSVVANQPYCPWTATSAHGWINITSDSSGVGNGIVEYLVAANSACCYRSGTMVIAGKVFTVNQAPAEGCQPIFCDGFDSGDTLRWSDTEP